MTDALSALKDLVAARGKATPQSWDICESQNNGRLVHVETSLSSKENAGEQIATFNKGSRDQRVANATFTWMAANFTSAHGAALVEELERLRAALETILNSDMAQREEDEGSVSTVLDLARAALKGYRT